MAVICGQILTIGVPAVVDTFLLFAAAGSLLQAVSLLASTYSYAPTEEMDGCEYRVGESKTGAVEWFLWVVVYRLQS